DGQPLADPRAAVHSLVGPRLKSDALDQLHNELRHDQVCIRSFQPGFLSGDPNAVVYRSRIVSEDLRTYAVFERGDDLSPRSGVFRISREYQHYVQRHSNRVAFYLDIALLHDVEQSNLDLSCEVGKLVYRKYAAVSSRQQAVVNCQFIGEQVAAACRLDRVQIANQISYRHVRRSQFFHVPLIARNKSDGGLIPVLG